MRGLLYAINDVLRGSARWFLAGAAVVAVVVVAVVVVAQRGEPEAATPFEAGLAVCSGSQIDFDPGAPSQGTWTGSHDTDSAELRCAWPDATPAAVGEHLEQLGYGSIEETSGLVDYLGRPDSWLVNAEHPELGGVSVAGVASTERVDVSVGGFIHIHDDGTQHHHGPDGEDLPD